jgi:hypothetical protein
MMNRECNPNQTFSDFSLPPSITKADGRMLPRQCRREHIRDARETERWGGHEDTQFRY